MSIFIFPLSGIILYILYKIFLRKLFEDRLIRGFEALLLGIFFSPSIITQTTGSEIRETLRFTSLNEIINPLALFFIAVFAFVKGLKYNISEVVKPDTKVIKISFIDLSVSVIAGTAAIFFLIYSAGLFNSAYTAEFVILSVCASLLIFSSTSGSFESILPANEKRSSFASAYISYGTLNSLLIIVLFSLIFVFYYNFFETNSYLRPVEWFFANLAVLVVNAFLYLLMVDKRKESNIIYLFTVVSIVLSVTLSLRLNFSVITGAFIIGMIAGNYSSVGAYIKGNFMKYETAIAYALLLIAGLYFQLVNPLMVIIVIASLFVLKYLAKKIVLLINHSDENEFSVYMKNNLNPMIEPDLIYIAVLLEMIIQFNLPYEQYLYTASLIVFTITSVYYYRLAKRAMVENGDIEGMNNG
ncbi:MAG: hypothetical protein L6Q59_03025 [Ignavibacteriaceae bacterium]|nr:hypothetical protein [Ignavibacteriaceae bacterium]